MEEGWSPEGENVREGEIVRVESTKFRLAQNRPARAFVRVIQCEYALQDSAKVWQRLGAEKK
jgi:hypothetical protein